MIESIYATVGGYRLHALQAGSGPAVLLLHGFAGSAEDWRPTVELLARSGYRAIAVDSLGFGLSDKPADAPYSLKLSTDLYLELMDSLGVQRAALVGHSMGGKYAITMALRFPERVARLFLADTEGFLPIPAWMQKGGTLPFLGSALFWLSSRPALISGQLRAAFYDADTYVTPALVERAIATIGDPGTRGALVALSRNFEATDLGSTGVRARLGELRGPVLIVWGAEDRIFPASCGATARREIPGARLVLIPRCGHFPQLEAYRPFHGLLLGFLGGACWEY